MQTVLEIGLPLGIFCLMFWLGLELRIADFSRILRSPALFLVGVFLQVVCLPAIALLIALLWPVSLSAGVVMGLMILAASPGGVTSNLFTRLAGGDTALSISLTAFMTLASIFTVPIIVTAAQWVVGSAGGERVSVANLAFTLFSIVSFPVALGVLSRTWFGEAVMRVERTARGATILLLVVLLALALIEKAAMLEDSLGNAALVALSLNLAAMAVAILASGLVRAGRRQTTALSLECGLQSTPTAITLVVLLDLPAEAILPAGFYGIWMIISASAFSIIRSKRAQGPAM